MTVLTFHHLKRLAAEVGLSVVSVTGAADLEGERGYLEAWQSGGFASEMEYMKRPVDLLTSPRKLLPSARSVVVIALFYERVPRQPLETGFGRIARYAWGRDYHKVLRQRLERLCQVSQQYLGRSVEYRVFADSVPLLERALANRAGLGFIGKNTMAILPKEGSFFFLGELIWDVDVEPDPQPKISSAHCGSCSNCLTQCPTGAFVRDRVLDSGRCISYLTIEKRSALTFQEREWIGEWLFGCDICQEVCPFNIVPLKKPNRECAPELSRDRGVGPTLSLEEVLTITSDSEYAARFQGTALMRAKRPGLARNATIVAANTHAENLLSLLVQLAKNDPSPLVRRHALWASAVIVARAGGERGVGVRSLLDRAVRDPDPGVREECELIRTQLRNFA